MYHTLARNKWQNEVITAQLSKSKGSCPSDEAQMAAVNPWFFGPQPNTTQSRKV